MNYLLTPAVKWLILITGGIFILQFLLQAIQPRLAENMILLLAMHGGATWQGQAWRPFTSIFLHADLFHLLFNMFALFSFGFTVEKSYGTARFLVLYLLGGIIAGLIFGLTSPDALCIGASGAVSTVLILSAMKYPGQIVIFFFAPMPIRIFAVAYVVIEMFLGLQDQFGGGSQVAHFAHLGGAAFGFAYFQVFDRKVRRSLPR